MSASPLNPPPNDEPHNLREWIPQVYHRACAHAHTLLRSWDGVNRPETASLVDRAICELLKLGEMPCQSREHALGMLIQKMRFVSVDIARGLNAAKRGGPGRNRARESGGERIPLNDLASPVALQYDQYLALDDALERLEQLSPRLRRVIVLRFMLGLSVEETATELDLTVSCVRRDTQLAKAWLYRSLVDLDEPSAPAP